MKKSTISTRTFITFNTVLTIILMSFIPLLTLSGCAKSPEDVKLADKDTIVRYAKREFGEAEYISEEEKKESITYTLKDTEAGFEYKIKTYVTSAIADGSVLWYQEDRTSTFQSAYQHYILSKLDSYLKEKEKDLGIEIVPGQLPYISFVEIKIGEMYNESNMINFLNDFSQKIKEIDKRNYFGNAGIELFSNGTEIGEYSLEDNEYKTAEEETVNYFMDAAEKILDKEVIFLDKKTLPKADVPGLSDENIMTVLGSDTENITCYYFTTAEDKKYFIADVNVYEKDFSTYHFYVKEIDN